MMVGSSGCTHEINFLKESLGNTGLETNLQENLCCDESCSCFQAPGWDQVDQILSDIRMGGLTAVYGSIHSFILLPNLKKEAVVRFDKRRSTKCP